MLRSTDRSDLAARINELKWFHPIDFGDGLVSPGRQDAARLQKMSDTYFSCSIVGKSVLDIGAWDGFHSVQAMKRGAASVTAVDNWNHWGNRACIELVRKYIVPDLKIIECDVYDISPETIGVHDVVLFAGVLYHLRHPLLGLEKVARVTGEWLVLETVMDAQNIPHPAMIMYPGSELNNDPTNWWGANRLCVESMLRDVGFTRIDFTQHPFAKARGIFHARRA
jgi:tRNA (mo5U34)-methyltransferase